MRFSKTYITVGYKCNNNCLFCYKGITQRNRQEPLSLIKSDLLKARKRNINAVDFDGGEPTIHPDIIECLKFAKKIGFNKINMVTNGRMFEYIGFCKEVIDSGVDTILFSIHGQNPMIHDALTQVQGSFKQADKGIDNLKSLSTDLAIGANVVLTRINYTYLREIVKYLRNKKVDFINLIGLCPIGNAYKNYKIIPTYTEISGILNRELKESFENEIKVHNVPFCFLSNPEKDTFYESKFKNEIEIDLPFKKGRNLGSLLAGMKQKSRFCFRCKYVESCGGIWKNYLKIFGSAEFEKFEIMPSPKEHSFEFSEVNRFSFNNLKCKNIIPKKSNPQLRQVKLNFGLKGIFFKENNILKYYESVKGIDIEKLEYIRKAGQIFINKSKKWPEGLFPLLLSNSCLNCKDYSDRTCQGYFEAARSDVLKTSDNEKKLIKDLKSLKGRVLDIGSGPVYHFRILKKLDFNNDVEYFCIDPDKKAISLARKRLRESKFICNLAEEVKLPKDFFDQILMIRSYSHIRNLGKALLNLKSSLKKDGVMIVMDNSYFAILNRIIKPKKDLWSMHYRAHTCKDAVNLLMDNGFRVIDRSDEKQGDGCWYIKCKPI